MKASFHWVSDSPSTKPVNTAATKTPVPAADNQLIVNLATSGLALTTATGGIRCTRLWSDGMSHTGRESVPANGEPSSVVLSLTSEKMPLSHVLNDGVPQSAQHATRMIHGIHAWIVSPVLYLYFQSLSSVVAVAVLLPAFASASRSD